MDGENGILAKIGYCDYVVLIAHIDSERFFRGGLMDEAFSRPSDIFAQSCGAYYKSLIDNRDLFKRFYERKGEKLPPLDFPKFLFSPACFVAFGDTDSIAMVAMDDFDLATRLISDVRLPIRQTCLAFSPRLDSLGLQDKKDIFCEFGDICDSGVNLAAETEKIRAPRHTFVRDRPLVVVTYFKLNGFSLLGPGLLLQEATYRAMARTIEDTIRRLLEQNTVSANKDIISENDIRSFRCTFLDPQSWSDVVTVMLCRNYSVIASVLVELRGLTMRNLSDASKGVNAKDLQHYVECFGLDEKVAQVADQIHGTDQKEDSHAEPNLGNNHLFCSNFSTLGVSHEAFEQNTREKAEEYYSGIVIASTNLVVCPGHMAELRDGVAGRYVAALRQTPGHLWYRFGHEDCVYQQLLRDDYWSRNAVQLFDLIQQIKSMRDFSIPHARDVRTRLATHIIEGCSDLQAPIANELELPRLHGGHVEIREVFDNIKALLFEGRSDGAFSVERLHSSIRKMQIPTPLSDAIIYLYVDYANCLGDAFLFDSVLDLHDIFTAMFGLIVDRLPKTMEGQNLDTYGARAFLAAEDLTQLVELVGLLRSALSHRIQAAFREATRWGVTLDVRGWGFNRLLSAADVPLKCGLGVLKKIMCGHTGAYDPFDKTTESVVKAAEIDEHVRCHVGGASGVSWDTRSYSHRIDIGDSYDYFLTSVDLNIAHLTRPEGLLIHLHETAHLICQLLADKVGCTHIEYKCACSRMCCHKQIERGIYGLRDSHLRSRYEDVFSEMIVHYFVFGNDYTTYLRNYAANFSLDPSAYCKDREEGFCRVFEVLMRGFLVTEPFRHPELDPASVVRGAFPSILDNAYSEFLKVIEDVGPFILGFDKVWPSPNDETIRMYFRKIYEESYCPVCCIWEDVRKICDGICLGDEDQGVQGYDPRPEDIGDWKDPKAGSLIGMIKEGLRQGRPLIRVLYEDPRPERGSEEYARLDAFFLVRHLLRLYITGLYGEMDTQEHTVTLARKADGTPDPDCIRNGKIPSRQLLDRNFNGLVAADPDTRAQYLRQRIVVIKTLWDISTNFRARRMKDILRVAWPNLFRPA